MRQLMLFSLFGVIMISMSACGSTGSAAASGTSSGFPTVSVKCGSQACVQ